MLLILAISVFLTSALSGVLGMGGGIILMVVLSAALPMATAFVVHGVVQLVANLIRGLLLREHLRPALIVPYAVGAVLAGLLTLKVGARPPEGIVHLAIGGMALLAVWRPVIWFPDGTSPAGSAVAGVTLTGVQNLAGVGGPLLELFYLRTAAGRHLVVATKAATQSIAHLVKVVCWLTIPTAGAGVVEHDPAAVLWLGGVGALTAVIGTVVGRSWLERLSEAGFRQWTRRLMWPLAGISLARGVICLANAETLAG